MPLLPGAVVNGQAATLGVMGGGQLGRMFVQAAQALGFETAVLDPDLRSPAGLISHHHIQTDYLDETGLAALAQVSHAITTESADAVCIAQDRRAEKAHFGRCGVPCAPYAVIASADDIKAVPATLLPGILKTAQMGYDGKGQVRIKTRADLLAAWTSLKKVPCVLEKKLALQAECSVIVARGRGGQIVNLPVNLNTHIDGILAKTEVFKQNLAPALAKQAISASKSIASELNYVGVLCVEFFVIRDEKSKLKLIVNEIAPRPHNSGHASMNACDVSQFELQVRTLAGLPLTQPRQHSPVIMLNLLGDLWQGEQAPAWDKVLALPGTHLHLYGKAGASKGRKMGHLNITGATVAEVRETAKKAARILGLAK